MSMLKLKVVVEGLPTDEVNSAKSEQRKAWKKLGWSLGSSRISDRRTLTENGETIEDTVKLSLVFAKKIRER